MENIEVKIQGTNYYIKRNGNVITYNWRNTGKKATLKPAKDKKGYLRVGLMINNKLCTKKVHRLVAITFIPNLENKPQVNHIDGNKSNNNVSNLEWVTQSENKKHAFRIGLESNIGSKNPFSVLKESDVINIRYNYNKGVKTIKELVSEYNLHISTIRRIVNRKTWTHI